MEVDGWGGGSYRNVTRANYYAVIHMHCALDFTPKKMLKIRHQLAKWIQKFETKSSQKNLLVAKNLLLLSQNNDAIAS